MKYTVLVILMLSGCVSPVYKTEVYQEEEFLSDCEYYNMKDCYE